MQHIKSDILSALSYFDIFHYPLTQQEIYLFLPHTCARQKFQDALHEMIDNKEIYKFQGYYSLTDDPLLAGRRTEGYAKAIQLLETAGKIASVIARFPYIRGIAVSGSLSKHFADEHSDIDFFIITAKNRLWIARTFTLLLTKISFLFRKQHLFCMNYYIDEQELEIGEKNIFTATEILTLLPLKGAAAFEAFYESNTWTQQFLPNHFMRVSSAAVLKNSILKRFIEMLFNNFLGNMIDNRLMHITARRWLKKTAQHKLNNHGIILSMATDKHYSKPDPSGFQSKLLKTYREKLAVLQYSTGVAAVTI